MKPVREFSGARPLAQHCAELLSRGGQAASQPNAKEEEAAKIALVHDVMSELTEHLPDRLRPLVLGERPTIAVSGPTEREAALLGKTAQEDMIHYLADQANAPRIVFSISTTTALSVTDRLFGGSGKIDAPASATLPNSAKLAMERVIKAPLACIQMLFDIPADDIAGDTAGQARLAQHEKLSRLNPFPKTADCLIWTITVSQDGSAPWDLTLAIEKAAALDLVTRDPIAAGGRPISAEKRSLARACHAVPLQLTAKLAELAWPVARLDRLKPGYVLPIAVPRTASLHIDDMPLAVGTLGSRDDNIALQLTRTGTFTL